MEFGTLFQQSTAFIKHRTSAFMIKLSGLKFITALPRLVTPVFRRQKTVILTMLPLSLFIVFGGAFLLNNHIHNLKQDVLGRGKSIISRFPADKAANWLARSRSSRSAWQIESLFKLKAITMSTAENRHLIYALITDDKDNQIKAHTLENLVGSQYTTVSGNKIPLENNGVEVLSYFDGGRNESLVDFALPIYYGKGENKIRIGTFHFGLSFKEVVGALKTRGIFLPLIFFATMLLSVALVVVKDKTESKKKAGIEADKSRFGPYILEKKIASGGMGELFLARKEVGKFRMRVAVKRILSERADDKDYISSLLDEANLASQLNHPNIATLHDFGNIQGSYFIAMEFIDGENLLGIMKSGRGKIPPGLIIYIVTEVCRGLDYAHKKVDDFSGQPLNIVHRDISPQNILVSLEGEVKIVDFGIARAAQRQSKKTTVGIVKGKLHYMSPEQASASSELDSRSDIFSLGLIFYELLSGKKVYRGETSQEVLRMACEADITPIGEVRDDIPDKLNRIIMKALEPEPSSRYQTAKELLEDLLEFTKDHPEFRSSKAYLSKFMQALLKDRKDASHEI